MEWVLEGKGEVVIGSLESEGDCSLDGPVGAEAVRDEPGSVEESGLDLISPEIFLNSTLLHGPANNLNNFISLVSDFNLVEAIARPVVALSHVPGVEVVLGVVVMTKIVGGIDKGSQHAYLNKNYITGLNLSPYIFTIFIYLMRFFS